MPVSFASYLEFDRASDHRHEFVDGRIVPMPPGDFRHAVLVSSVNAVVGNAVEHLPYVVTAAALRLQVNEGAACFYPDVMVFRDQPQCFDCHEDVVSNPTVIVEVGSEATGVWDRAVKFRNYRSISTLREYVLVWPDGMCIEWCTRRDNGDWIFRAVNGPEGACHLESIGVSLLLAGIYRKIHLLSNPAATPAPKPPKQPNPTQPLNRQSAIK